MSPKQSIFTRPVVTVCLVLLVILFEACADKIKTDLIAYRTTDQSLTNSNNAINEGNQTIIKSLEDRLTQPAAMEKSKILFPKAQLIQKYSDDVYSYIEGLRSELKKEAGLKTNAGEESFRESDKPSVSRLFVKKEKGKELFEHLTKYKENVLAVDSLIPQEFNNVLLIIPGSFKTDGANDQDFAKTFFDDIPVIAALAVLSAFQNNVRIAESRLLSFCHNQLVVHTIHWWPTAIVCQNITRPEPGELIEVTAGIVSTTSSLKTEVIVGGKKVQVDEYGLAAYKFQASTQAGKHTVPVTLKFIDQEGKEQYITKNVEYAISGNK